MLDRHNAVDALQLLLYLATTDDAAVDQPVDPDRDRLRLALIFPPSICSRGLDWAALAAMTERGEEDRDSRKKREVFQL